MPLDRRDRGPTRSRTCARDPRAARGLHDRSAAGRRKGARTPLRRRRLHRHKPLVTVLDTLTDRDLQLMPQGLQAFGADAKRADAVAVERVQTHQRSCPACSRAKWPSCRMRRWAHVSLRPSRAPTSGHPKLGTRSGAVRRAHAEVGKRSRNAGRSERARHAGHDPGANARAAHRDRSCSCMGSCRSTSSWSGHRSTHSMPPSSDAPSYPS
jgi:hypothetical protein